MSEAMTEKSEAPTSLAPQKKNRKTLKVLALGFGLLVGVSLTIALIIPRLVNVDQYRPQILEIAQKYVNGKIELGPLSLSLWGRIEVRMQGLKISDLKGQTVIQVADAGFHFPFLPLLSGKPVLTLRMLQPEIVAIRDELGQLNLMSLPRFDATQGAALPTESKNETTSLQLPGIALAARLGVRVEDARFIVKDRATQATSEIDHFNFELKNASLNDTAELAVWGNLSAQVASKISVAGPFRVDSTLTPHIDAVAGKFLNADIQARGEFSDLKIEMPGLFIKEAGIPARFTAKLSASATTSKLESFDFQFFNAELKSAGSITLGTAQGQSPIVEYRVSSNAIDFAGWSKLIPMLKEYDLKGSGSLQAEVKGPSDRIQYQAQFTAKDLSAQSPKLKAVPVMQFSMKVVTDRVEEILFGLKAPGNDLQVKGKVVSFNSPRAEFSVTSSGLDFDQLLVLPPLQKAKGESEKTGSPAGSSQVESVASASDYDALLEPVRSNEMLKRFSALIDVNLQTIKVYDVKMSAIRGRMTFQNLVGALEKGAFGLWEGRFKADMSFDLKPKVPTYRYSLGVEELNLRKAVDSQFALFKNTLLGQAFFSVQGSGASFNPTVAQKNLDAKGSWQVKNATFATADIGKVAVDAINGAIGKIASQIPEAKERMLKVPGSRESGYESVGASFSISKGVFSMPDFLAKSKVNAGVDLKGSTAVTLSEGYPIQAKWEIIDTYNFTKARDISVQQAGIRVDNLFAEGTQPVHFPVTVGCKAVEPCFNTTEVPEYLARVALGKITKAATQKVEAEVKKKAESVVNDLGKKAAPEVDKVLKKLKGLF